MKEEFGIDALVSNVDYICAIFDVTDNPITSNYIKNNKPLFTVAYEQKEYRLFILVQKIDISTKISFEKIKYNSIDKYEYDYIESIRQRLEKVIDDPELNKCLGVMFGMVLGDALGGVLEFIGVGDNYSCLQLSKDSDTFEYIVNKYIRDKKIGFNILINADTNDFAEYNARDGFINTTYCSDSEKNITIKGRPGQTGPVDGMRGGIWTDDTSMGLCILDSLMLNNEFNGTDIRLRFLKWHTEKYNNAEYYQHQSIGLGGNILVSMYSTILALDHKCDGINSCWDYDSMSSFNPTKIEHVHNDNKRNREKIIIDIENASGNGGLMRLGAIPIAYRNNHFVAAEYSVKSSITTHRGCDASITAHFMGFLISSIIKNNNPDATIKGLLGTCRTSYIDTYLVELSISALDKFFKDPFKNSLLLPDYKRIESAIRSHIRLYLLLKSELFFNPGSQEHFTTPNGKWYIDLKTKIVKTYDIEDVETKTMIDTQFNSIKDDITKKCTFYNWRCRQDYSSYKKLCIDSMTNRGINYNGYPNNKGYFGSYSMDALAIALYCTSESKSLADALMKAVNLLGDCDTTAAITGQIAGAYYGINSTLFPPQAPIDIDEKRKITALRNYYNKYIKSRQVKIDDKVIVKHSDILTRTAILYDSKFKYETF